MQATGQQRFLPRLSREREKEKVELTVRQIGGTPRLEMRSLRWGQGIGWYVQKTIVLAPQEVSQLARLLRRFSASGRAKTGGRKILPFPKNKTR